MRFDCWVTSFMVWKGETLSKEEQLPLVPDMEVSTPTQADLFEWAEEEKEGNLIDITYLIRLKELAEELILDLGIDISMADLGSVEFATQLLDVLEGFDGETIEDDYPELFSLLRARTGR